MLLWKIASRIRKSTPCETRAKRVHRSTMTETGPRGQVRRGSCESKPSGTSQPLADVKLLGSRNTAGSPELLGAIPHSGRALPDWAARLKLRSAVRMFCHGSGLLEISPSLEEGWFAAQDKRTGVDRPNFALRFRSDSVLAPCSSRTSDNAHSKNLCLRRA